MTYAELTAEIMPTRVEEGIDPLNGRPFKLEWFDDVEQRSADWFALRAGIVTCSNFDQVMAVGREGVADSKVRSKLLRLMAGEILSGQPMESFSSSAMERGKEMEADIVRDFCLGRGEPTFVGFARRTIYDPLFGEIVIGGSPDALIGADSGLEVKSMQPDLIVGLVESGRFPSEHTPQVQGYMWLTGRKKWTLRVGYRGMPIRPSWAITVDQSYILSLEDRVRAFYRDLEKLVASVCRKGGVA